MAINKLRPLSNLLQERFWAKVDVLGPDKCWLWLGARTKKFYGYWRPYNVKGPNILVHRMAYFLHTGFDPAELVVIHTCDDTLCVNPRHLKLGTQAENLADMRRKGRGFDLPHRFGETSSHAKLTDAQIAEIRRLAGTTIRRPEGSGRQYIPGYWSHKRLAETFGVGATQIGRILRGESR